MLLTFGLTTLAWVFFRAPTVGEAVRYIGGIFTAHPIQPLRVSTTALLLSSGMLVWEWLQRERAHGLEIEWIPRPLRHMLYVVLITLTFEFARAQRQFIYFQF